MNNMYQYKGSYINRGKILPLLTNNRGKGLPLLTNNRGKGLPPVKYFYYNNNYKSIFIPAYGGIAASKLY